MKALILAGGLGTRLRKIVPNRPKSMALVNGRPFLEFVLKNLRTNQINEVVLAIGYLGHQIKNFFSSGQDLGMKISYSEEGSPLGTGGAVKKAERFFKESFLVLNGDTYLETDLTEALSFHQQKKAKATLVLTKNGSARQSGLVIGDNSGRIVSFLEKPIRGKRGLVNSGYYFFKPEVLRTIPENKKVSLEREIFPDWAQKGFLYGFPVDRDFSDMGTPSGYQQIQKRLAQKGFFDEVNSLK